MAQPIKVQVVEGQFAVSRLPAQSDLPDWFNGPGFSAMVRADDELTLVCLQSRVPADVESDRGWACLRSVGPFEFDAAGIVLSLIAPLSENGIGVFVLCTFDGEHVLVKQGDLGTALALLEKAGHSVAP